MSEQQSLYELLGLSDKASPQDIQQACAATLRALAELPDSEDKRNRIAILNSARDVLLDRRLRAGYDRRQRDRRELDRREDRQPPAAARRAWPALFIALACVAGYAAWQTLGSLRNEAARETTAAQAEKVAPTPDLVLGREARERGGRDEDTAPTPAAASGSAPAPAAKGPARLVTNAANAGVLAKFAESTYMIVGSQGVGSAVVIDTDRLLTNCHVVAPNVLKGPIHAVNALTQARTLVTAAAFLVREDACVLHAPGLGGRPIAFGDTSRLAPGTALHNIGFAGGRLISSQGTFHGMVNRAGQTYLSSSNYCDHGVSGGPLVDDEGRLMGLTSGGPKDRGYCLSLTAETARQVLAQTLIAIDAFPGNYMSNLQRTW